MSHDSRAGIPPILIYNSETILSKESYYCMRNQEMTFTVRFVNAVNTFISALCGAWLSDVIITDPTASDPDPPGLLP